MYRVHLLIVSCFVIFSCYVYAMDEPNSQGTHSSSDSVAYFIMYTSPPLLISTLDHAVLNSGDFEGIEHVCDCAMTLYIQNADLFVHLHNTSSCLLFPCQMR